MDGNGAHTKHSTLPTWQEDYISEVKRTGGKDARFAACGGGWYALFVTGDTEALKPRVRRCDVLTQTAALKNLPDCSATPQ